MHANSTEIHYFSSCDTISTTLYMNHCLILSVVDACKLVYSSVESVWIIQAEIIREI